MTYTDDTARAVFIKAGGDPDHSGPLAAWAESVIGTDDMAAGVIVAEDGTILAHTRRSGRPVAASYVTSVADPAHAGVVNVEAGLAAGRLRRLTGQGTIEVTYSQVCKGAGTHVRRAAQDTHERMDPATLRTYREALGLTQAGLGERMPRPGGGHVTAETVRWWERGKDPIPYGVPAELAVIAADRAAECQAVADALR